MIGNTVLHYQVGIACMGKLMRAEKNIITIDDFINSFGAKTYGFWLQRRCVDTNVQNNKIINYSSATKLGRQ